MCGICGIVHFKQEPVDPGALDRACASLHHRGPDHKGVWLAPTGSVGLGSTRLAILDPSPACHQPMHRPGGRYHLIFNGEIYNFRSLRKQLIDIGERFETDGDTEVILTACAVWGIEAMSRFNGMWALAFYDSQSGCGFLSRDRFGIKPLLYSSNAHGLLFASELRALTLLDRLDQTIDPEALVQHLQFGYIAHPATIYRAARRLPPGHYLSFTRTSVGKPTRHYQPSAPSEQLRRTTAQYTQTTTELRHTLADAVVRRRVCDVPIGVLLSGGLDSSIVVAHLAEATGRSIQTFSIGYAGQKSYDETHYARLIAKRFDTQHRELRLTEGAVIDAIPSILDHLGEPVGDSSIVPTALLCRFARQFVTVALSGDGGDELFGGYWRYLGHRALATYRRIPGSVRRFVVAPLLATLSASRSSVSGRRVRQLRKLLRSQDADPLTRHLAWSRILAPEAQQILKEAGSSAACDARTLEQARRLTETVNGADSLHRILMFDLQYSLPGDMLQKVDLASMMHSLEVRVPLLDHKVVELALAMPSSFKIQRGLRKRILIDAYRGHLPNEVLDRPKQGFEVPVGEYFRGPLRDMFHDVVTPSAIDSFGLLNYSAVEEVYQQHLTRRTDHADLLWTLLSLCWWQAKRTT